MFNACMFLFRREWDLQPGPCEWGTANRCECATVESVASAGGACLSDWDVSGVCLLQLTLLVLDVNDNTPIFAEPEYSISVTEGEELDQVLLTLSASDADAGTNQQIFFFLEEDGGMFSGQNATRVTSQLATVLQMFSQSTLPPEDSPSVPR